MRRFWTWLTLLLVAVGSTPAQEVAVQPVLSHTELAPGQKFQMAVVLTLADPWHVNANPASLPEFIPTTLTLDQNPSVTFDKPTYPPGKAVKVTWADEPVSLYEGKVIIRAEGQVTGPKGPVTITGKLRYQACDNQVCFAPQTVPVSISTVIGEGGQPAHPDIFTGMTTNAAAPAPEPAGGGFDVGASIGRRGLLLTLVLVFLGGLALNLTPCVFPMIAITVSYFGGAGERKLAPALAYFAGIVVTYSTLGVVAALTGGLFGAALQSPWVLVSVAVVMVALALSMFGLYELQPPQALMQKAAGLSSKVGLLGVFLLGATVGIIAAPCLGPVILGVLLFVAQRGDPWLGWWLFFTLACGLGLPYVILGRFSGLLAKLPRSGGWMVWVKRAFGIIFLLIAFWFVRPLLVGKSDAASPIAWQKYSADALVNPGKPVIIDFYADWCIPCHEMDKKTFRDERVIEKSKQFVMLKADLTASDSPAAERLMKQYNVSGVPTFVFLDASGREHSRLRQVGFVPADDFLRVMEAAQEKAAPSASTDAPALAIPPALAAPF